MAIGTTWATGTWSSSSWATGSWANVAVGGVTVPDVVGQSQASGTTELEGEGFVVSVLSENSSTVAVGNIISQNPSAGASAPSGSTVVIVVSLGASTSGSSVVVFRRHRRGR